MDQFVMQCALNGIFLNSDKWFITRGTLVEVSRQSEHVSHYLFLMRTKGLSSMLNHAQHVGQ